MIEILTGLQLLNGGALLLVLGMVAWLVGQQRRQAMRAAGEGSAAEAMSQAESFTQELTLTADAIIDRYEQQRLKLEETARRVERLVAVLEQAAPPPATLSAGGRRRKTEEPAARELSVTATNGARRPEPAAVAAGELELMKKMQALRGGDSK